jgi:hypothetical protein
MMNIIYNIPRKITTDEFETKIFLSFDFFA